MIDIRLIRESPELVKENIKKKFQDSKIKLVDEIKKKDESWRELKQQTDDLRASRNKISIQVGEAKKAGKDAKKLLAEAKKIPFEIEKIEFKSNKLEREINELLMQIPNIMHPSVPTGKDETKNPELRRWGKIPKFDFELKNHAELIEKLGLVDFDAARINSGNGFNYLIGHMALLDQALQRYGLDFIVKKGFTPVGPPIMLNFETLLGALNGLKDFEDVVYKVEKEDLYLIGTAEHALVGMLKGKTVQGSSLPLKYCALTPCFRKEVGSHSLDTKGLYRMHQFNKVEQVVFSTPENSFALLEEMQKITEDFFQSLKIPYRVIEICSGDLGAKFAKQYDIEAWFPRQEKYGEVTSAGNCTDFQARALNIKYWDKGERKLPHIINNTMVATSRAMVAILENFQQHDGSVKVPEVLVPYMHGIKFLGK
ncbi:MAG: serine--tRNA ligase [Nanoarchaeota archaeon]